MLVTSIFSFSYNVFKRLLFRVLKSWDCVVKSFKRLLIEHDSIVFPVLKVFLTHHLVGIAKSIEPGQAAQSAQTDQGRKLSLLADFL